MAQRAARASKGARRGPAGRRQAKKPPARKASDRRKRTIDARAKTIVVAAEPPIDRDPANLVPAFRERLEESLQALEASGTPFKFVEGFRTVERQQWLYGSGRPGAPFGRQGAILTFKDGVKALSNHQGDGTPGSGRAADCYPVRDVSLHSEGVRIGLEGLRRRRSSAGVGCGLLLEELPGRPAL
jgi:hypothetical protein